MKTTTTSQQVRQGLNNKKFNPENGLTAVIATIPVSLKKQDLGIQFWSNTDLANGFRINVDSSLSKFVELY